MKDFHHPFEYSALRYLLLWEQRERGIYEEFRKKPSPSSLRKAMHHFRISRSFPGVGNDKVAQWVIAAIDAVDSAGSPAAAVHTLARRFERQFGSFNLSAASKLLWWKHRYPHLIYDSRAAAALGDLAGYDRRSRSYEEYEHAWRAAQRASRESIEKAIARLPIAHPFVTAWHPTVHSIVSLASEQWFQDRVFDVYLWDRGGAG